MAEPQTGRVTIENDVVYGTGGGRDLRCDVFTPPAETANGAGVLAIHGGGWVRGERAQLRGYGILLGRLGYTCVLPEYRLATEAQWPACLHDVKAALRWMRANASKLGIDPAKIAVEGNSAGGHLSLMLAATEDNPQFDGDGGNDGVSTAVAACISFYGPALLGSLGAELSAPVVALLGEDPGAERIAEASPVTYARASFPPTMLLTGNRDTTVPDRSSFEMYRHLDEAGAPVELHVFAGAPHAFDRDPQLGRQTAALMAVFLDRYVVNPRALAPEAAAAG
jgi:acetyl esterase/lipase